MLAFRVLLKRGPTFTLDVEGNLPLTGITAITGPSGGGKTTLLRALAGLERAERARILFRDEEWEGRGHSLPVEDRRVGFVFQSPYLFPHLTVQRNLGFGARRRQVQSYDAIVEALDLAPLLRRGVRGLSGGELRRVALGRALASNPAILFLDEPLTGLDNARKAELLPYIARAVAEAQVPAIYVSHRGDEIATLADRVLGLSGGRLTGWEPAPIRLAGRVISVGDGLMKVRLEGAGDDDPDFTLPALARSGERIGLGLPPESLLVSAANPGRTDALAVLTGEVVESGAGLAVAVSGQRIRIPRGGPHPAGAPVWLSVLRVLPRPEPGDSPEI